MARINTQRIKAHVLEDGRWIVVMDGSGPDDYRKVRLMLTESRVKWKDESDELSLELVDPNPIDIMKTRQIVADIFKSKIKVVF